MFIKNRSFDHKIFQNYVLTDPVRLNVNLNCNIPFQNVKQDNWNADKQQHQYHPQCYIVRFIWTNPRDNCFLKFDGTDTVVILPLIHTYKCHLIHASHHKRHIHSRFYIRIISSRRLSFVFTNCKYFLRFRLQIQFVLISLPESDFIDQKKHNTFSLLTKIKIGAMCHPISKTFEYHV